MDSVGNMWTVFPNGGGPADAFALKPGRRIGPYVVDIPLGYGSVGETYLVTHAFLDTFFVLKLFYRNVVHSGQAADLHAGLRRVARLRHEHIVGIHHADLSGEYACVVSDAYVDMATSEPRDLGRVLGARGSLTNDEAVHIGMQLCDALEYAHIRGVVHGNLKAANVLLTDGDIRSASVKVADFGQVSLTGTAWFRDQAQASAAAVSIGLGETVVPTPGQAVLVPPLARSAAARALALSYDAMSPEQRAGGEPDERSDVYALGLLFLQMLGCPAPGASKGTRSVDRDEPVSQWRDLILWCLEETSGKRPATMREVMRQLCRMAGNPMPPPLDPDSPRIRQSQALGCRVLLDGARSVVEGIQPGVLLDHYEIQELIGVGGMGAVFRAADTRADTQVAVKVLMRSADAYTEAEIRRFRQEADIVRSLAHPVVVHVHDSGSALGYNYLVMDLFLGPFGVPMSLADYMRMGYQADIPSTVGVVCRLLEALEAAHASGVVHCDIKPANVLLKYLCSEDDRGEEMWVMQVKLTDFGLAQMLGEDLVLQSVRTSLDSLAAGGSKADDVRALIGTYDYMSPEQRRGEPATPQSDLYAIGLILFQMLTGEREPGLARPSRLRKGLNPTWDAVIASALSEDPAERFESAAAMRDALRVLPS